MAETRTSLAEASEWLEMPVDGLGGRTLGRVAGIHLDAEDGEPRWLLIKLGPLAGSTAIPVEHADEAAERVWIPYDRDSVHEAPRFKPDESLSAAQELELAAHWGIGEGRGRAAEVAERDADEITAVPAEVDD
jgi:PRC-barrel domain protein